MIIPCKFCFKNAEHKNHNIQRRDWVGYKECTICKGLNRIPNYRYKTPKIIVVTQL